VGRLPRAGVAGDDVDRVPTSGPEPVRLVGYVDNGHGWRVCGEVLVTLYPTGVGLTSRAEG
jgi:hypothetical protein